MDKLQQPESDQVYYIAENFFNKGYYDHTVKAIIESEDTHDKDIPILLKYIDRCTQMVRNAAAELTIREMKKQIGQAIGRTLSDGYTSTVSRDDMYIIYNYIMMQTKE